MGATIGKVVDFLIPANYKPIVASAVAKVLRLDVPSASGRVLLKSGALRGRI